MPTATPLPSLAGPWLMSESRVHELLSRFRAAAPMIASFNPTAAPELPDDPGYTVVNGVAEIEIVGCLVKYPSWYDDLLGLSATIPLMDAVRRAAADPTVKSIALLIDSGGGMVAGTTELAAAIAEVNRKKPVHALVSDLCASGAMWIASQCTSISANPTGFVGSVGVYTVLTDDTKMWGDVGIKFTTVSTGGIKGAGADGNVTPALVGDVQREVNAIYEQFVAAVASGRKMSVESVRKLADGRCWIAAEARAFGLIDAVADQSAALAAIRAGTVPARTAVPLTPPPMPAMPAPTPAPAPAPDTDPDPDADHKRTYAAMDRFGKLDNAGLFEAWKAGRKAGDIIEETIAAATRARRAGCDSDVISSAWRVATTVISTPTYGDTKMDSDHKAQAERDWDAMSAEARTDWYSRDVFLRSQVAEREGRIKGAKSDKPAAASAPVPYADPAPVAAKAPATPSPAATSTTTSTTSTAPSATDCKARAKAEWDANLADCHNEFASEAAYIGYRKAALSGRVPKR